MQYFDFFSHLKPYLIVYSTVGSHLVNDSNFLKNLEGDITKIPDAQVVRRVHNTTVRVPYGGQNLYIKHNGEVGTAPYEFIGMQELSPGGMHIVPIVLAIQSRIVTLEVIGEHPNYDDTLTLKIFTFYEAAKKVFRRAFGGDRVLIGTSGYILGAIYNIEHLLVRDLDSDNPLDWFTAIDAIEVDQGY